MIIRASASRCRSIRDRRGPQARRRRDLVVRAQESFPPRAPGAAADALGEQPQALVLPALDDAEVRRVLVDQRLYQRAGVAQGTRVVSRAGGKSPPGTADLQG